MESKSRSTALHDTQTNARGRILEDFFTSNYLHTLNEDCDYPTFSGARGSSNIDLSLLTPNYSEQCTDGKFGTRTAARTTIFSALP